MLAPLAQLPQGFRSALTVLATHRLRTVLTLLGNIVAMMSVISVASVLSGVDTYVREEIAEEGSNTLVVTQFDPFAMFSDPDAFERAAHNPSLTLRDVDYLREADIPDVVCIDARAAGTVDLQADAKKLTRVTIEGRTSNYPRIESVAVDAGRFFTEHEETHARPVAVIGVEVADQLFLRRDPVGRVFIANGQHLEVVGVFEERSASLGSDPNRLVVVPVRTYFRLVGPQSIDVPIKAATITSLESVVEDTRMAMRVRRGLRPAEPENFAVTTARNLLQFWEKINRSLFLSLVGIVSISLVVGGVVVMNTMLVSVTERTREIGLRKALGAARRDILWQFLFESVSLSVVGGGIGIGLGFAMASAVGAFTPLPYAIEPWSIVAGITVTVAAGLAAGVYPAARAARLDPAEALRHE
jgi:putative ABC transport system permease protein